MRRIIIGTVLILLLLTLAGCKQIFLPKAKEINDLQLVQVIGIDKLADDPNDCMVTIASKNLEAGSGGNSGNMGGDTDQKPGSNKLKALVLTASGKTIFDAVRNLQTHSSKSIFWGHAEYYLIGEEAAKDDITKYIDFFIRDHELRIESKVYIVKGTTAKELIEQFNLSGFLILDKLESLGNNIGLLSTSEEMPVHKLIRFIDVHHASARVPCIQLVDRDSETGKQIKDIDTCGYAIFSDFKLKGYIGTDISRGVNLITNNVDTSIVTIKDKTDQDVSLEIISSNTKVVPYFNGDDLEGILLKTKVTSNIGEVQSQTGFTDEESLKHMETQQSETLEHEMRAVLDKILQYKSDCLEICDRVQLSKPMKWHKIRDRWMQLFTSVPIDIQVESSIKRTYDIKEPSGKMMQE